MSWAAPYVGLRVPQDVADCWDLVRKVYRDTMDIRLPSFDDEYDHPESEEARQTLSREMNTWAAWKRVESPRAMDLVVYNGPGRVADHVGIVIGNGQFLHAFAKQVAAPRLGHPHWMYRREGFYTYAP